MEREEEERCETAMRRQGLVNQRPMLFVMLFVIAADGAFLAFGYIAQALLPSLPTYLLSDASEGGMLVVTLGVIARLGWLGKVGLNGPSKWRDLRVLWLPIVITAFFVLGSLNLSQNLSGEFLVSVFISVFIIGFSEELAFRGVVLQTLIPGGTRRAVIVSSAIFGLIHLDNLVQAGAPGTPVGVAVQVLFSALFGVAFGSYRVRTNTIWPVIVFHALPDISALFVQNSTGETSTLNPSTVVIELDLGVVVASYGLYLLRERHRDVPVQDLRPSASVSSQGRSVLEHLRKFIDSDSTIRRTAQPRRRGRNVMEPG